MRLRLIACEIARREIAEVLPSSPHEVTVEYLEQGYHNDVAVGNPAIQVQIDALAPDACDAILLGYGLCNNMLAGIQARHAPMVVPRSHDCITWFLGSKERYRDYFDANPGTYYYTAGWLDHSSHASRQSRATNVSLPGMPGTWEELVEKYGEDNAEYLLESLGGWRTNYTHGTLIRQGLGCDDESRERVHEICDSNEWEYKDVEGDLNLLRRWVCGDWDDDAFLTVEPGMSIVPSYGDDIVQIESPV
jgi:hypothetical protein